MANILRLCSNFNYGTIKSFPIRKIGSRLFESPTSKTGVSNKCYHFTKRKINVKPLSIYAKISIGIAAGISVKFCKENSVLCFVKDKSRLVGQGTSSKEPQFNWRKFFILLKEYWPELLGAILAAFVCALFNILIPKALGEIVDIFSKVTVLKDHFFDEMKKPAIRMILYYSLQSIFTFIYIALLSRIGEEVGERMKVQLFSSVMNQDIEYFDRNRTGELLNRLTVDIQDFKSSFKRIISHGLRNMTQIIGYSVSLFFISPSMTGVMLIIVPTAIITGTYIGSLLRELSHKAKSQGGKVTLTAEEAISNIRTVRAFAMEKVEKQILTGEAELFKELNVKLGYGIALFQAGTNLFLNGMVLGTIYFGGYLLTNGSITAGELMSFLVAVQMLQRSFSQVSLLFGTYIKGKHAGARVFEVIDLPKGKTLTDGKIIPHHSLIPSVEFKNVVFAYPTRPKEEVLKTINLSIPEGKTVAIVGASGSGKSTLAWLLERFYDVKEGTILVGGTDIKELNSNWLRGRVIGFISQEPVLFATTVMENIRYAKPEATDDEVIQAAKLANADTFIKEFPSGYQTMVGERGVSVSGGQKQRIAIARALLKNPSILVLDEATSALDSESEKLVQQALDNVTKSRTTIVIAHRLSTVKNADLIVVLHNGVILESGTHTELLNKKGMYAALVQNQMEDRLNKESEKIIQSKKKDKEERKTDKKS